MIAIYRPSRNQNIVGSRSGKYDYFTLTMIDMLVGYIRDSTIATRLNVPAYVVRARRVALGIESHNERIDSKARMVRIID